MPSHHPLHCIVDVAIAPLTVFTVVLTGVTLKVVALAQSVAVFTPIAVVFTLLHS